MLRKYLCWLLGHSYICLYRKQWGGHNDSHSQTNGSEYTGWICQHCDKQRFEQWDK